MTLQQWIAEYLRIHGDITHDVANTLRGCTYSGFTGRIAELRAAGWQIDQTGGVYTLVAEPDDAPAPPELVTVSREELVELANLLRVAAESLDRLTIT